MITDYPILLPPVQHHADDDEEVGEDGQQDDEQQRHGLEDGHPQGLVVQQCVRRCGRHVGRLQGEKNLPYRVDPVVGYAICVCVRACVTGFSVSQANR